MTQLSYRPDIDGLRSLAVVPVILFHAGASWMPGGFVGVDIFFVISGYLISSIILREVQSGAFSFLRFYERRLRRIIPAMLAMLLVTVAVFQMIALPDQAQHAAESGLAALFSVSNFYFWKESGYFAPTAEFFPFLHTWSLAVEEQFYVIFPVVLLAIWKLRLPMKTVIVLGTIVSFALGCWLSLNKPTFAYYLLPARAWELGIGVVIAAGAVPPIRGKFLNEAVPAVGVGMILFALFWVQGAMVFPGWVALIPCLGAALVIHAGGHSWVARCVLSARPMVFVGLLSYSLYLWHWPVLAALRIRTASLHLDLTTAVGAITLIALLAWISWRFVEKPFRDQRSMSFGRLLPILGTGALTLCLVGGISIAMSGFPGRLSEPVLIAQRGADDVDPLREICRGMTSRSECRFGSPEKPITYAIIGDSHAAALRPAIEASDILGESAGTLYWEGACPLLQGASLQGNENREVCEDFKEYVWDEVASNSELNTVILAGRWPYQMLGWAPERGGSFREPLVDDETTEASTHDNPDVMARSLSRTLRRLRGLGLDVIIIGAVPEAGFDVPNTIAMARYSGRDVPHGIRRRHVERRAGAADRLISALAHKMGGVTFLSIWQDFCSAHWCDIERAGMPIYYDDDHLSQAGALGVAAPALRSAYGS